VSHLEVTISTLHDQATKQKSKLEADYKKTLDDNKTRLESATKVAKKDLTDTEVELSTLKDRLETYKENYNEMVAVLKDDIELLNISKSELETSVDALRIETSNLESKKINQQIIIDNLLSDEERLKTERQRLSDEIAALKTDISNLKTDKTTLESDFNTTKQDYDKQIVLLEDKLRRLGAQCNAQAQKIIEESTDNDKIRDNLANMQKALDERDRNIRIREQKVTQSEGTILRNSNLLNL